MRLKFEEELEHVLQKYSLNKQDFCLVGSAVLSVLGIRDNSHDLDICLRSEVVKKLIENYGVKPDSCSSKGIKFTNHIEAHINRFVTIGLSDNEIFERCTFRLSDGYNVLLPEILFCYKLKRKSQQDIADVRMMEKWVISAKNWNWELVRKIMFSNNTAAKCSHFSGLRGIGKIVPRIIRFVIRCLRDPFRTLNAVRYKLIANQMFHCGARTRKPGPILQAQLLTRIHVGALLANQFQYGAFARYDVLLRYLAVKYINEGSEEYKSDYLRMQNERMGIDSHIELCDLVSSIRQRGVLDRYPIPITEEGVLVDGAHRLACALYFKVQNVPVTILPSREKIDYGRQWFVDHGFSEQLLVCLDKIKDELFEQYGVLFPVLLWPSVMPWFNEISEKINSQYRIKWTKELILDNTFADFMRKIYAIDDIERWKVELKINALSRYEKRVRVLTLEIPNPQFRAKKQVNSYLSAKGESLKKCVRDSYQHRVADYFYDIVCHTGDNHEHNQQIFEIVKLFKNA